MQISIKPLDCFETAADLVSTRPKNKTIFKPQKNLLDNGKLKKNENQNFVISAYWLENETKK